LKVGSVIIRCVHRYQHRIILLTLVYRSTQLLFCFLNNMMLLFYYHIWWGLNQWRIQRGAEGTFAPPPLKRERGRSSVPLLNISAFIHSPVKCNKSLYIFTRCIALLVYLITFELLKQSTINQKIKWYYNPLDINFIKIHPFYKHFNTNYPIFNRETWENWLI
jgi:hypothetical protein